MKIKLIKDLKDWKSIDFLYYFKNRLINDYNIKFNIPNEAIGIFCGRIKQFMKDLNLNNYEYKDYIDNVFSGFFSNEKYAPNFGAIVSKKVYKIVYKVENLSEKIDWEQVRKEVSKYFEEVNGDKD